MQNLKVRYIKDADGNEKEVVIAIDEWKKIEGQLHELMYLSSVKSGLKEAFLELKDVLKGNKKAENAKDFLNEC